MGNWFIDTAGIGSLIVITVATTVLVTYFRMLRWIQTTPPDRPQPAPPATLPSIGQAEGNAVPQTAGGGK